MRLYHISDQPGIERFEPRQAADGTLKVWAVDPSHVCNYLLPRDCPRVCFGRGMNAAPGDIAALLGSRQRVVAIEAAWEGRVREATLFVYDLPSAPFALADANAGYWTSPTTVAPVAQRTFTDLPARMVEHGATLVVLTSLWPLHDQVAASSLEYSMIRMRNAAPRS